MNQDQPELTLEESVKQVMQTLPPVIREYLSQGRYTPVARNLMAKYGLRIDQGGVLEREIMLLLMGIENPDEFSKALAEEAKLDQKTINGIVEDINTQIFVPLRDEMQKGSAVVSEATKPVTSQPQQPVASQASPQVAAAQPPRPDWGSHNPRAETQPPQAQSGRPGLRNLLASITKEVPKSVESRKLLEDHEEPSPSLKATESAAHIEFKKPPAVPGIVVPLPPPPAPARAVPLSPKPVVEATPKPAAPATPAKPYSVDPYREPLDEK